MHQGSWLGTLIIAWTPTLMWPHGWRYNSPSLTGWSLCAEDFVEQGMDAPEQTTGWNSEKSVFSTLGRVRHGGGLVAKSSLALAIP